MTMRADWQKAKKTSNANFKKAYDNWMKEQEKKAKLGDPKAAKAFAKELVKTCDSTFGHEYTSPMSFDEDLGPTLDKIEKTHAKVDPALKNLSADDLIKKKALNVVWKYYAEKVGYCAENYQFLCGGYKLAPNKIYEIFIAKGAKLELNINNTQITDIWHEAAQSGDWKAAKAQIKPIYEIVHGMTASDTIPKMLRHAQMPKLLRDALGGKDMPKLIAKARKACSVYGRQSQAYGKRWKKEKPDFWTPVNQCLNDILGELDKLAGMYPS